jgi:GNAT superfamily N-acetyltransferase
VPIEVREEPLADLAGYARISIAFTVDQKLEAIPGETAMTLTARPVETPFVKDYDQNEGNHPTGWPSRFDMSSWARFAAYDGGTIAGGAVIAWRSKELDLLGRGDEIATLFDIRVAADKRRTGVGAALFDAAEAWARARACRGLAVETQSTNVGACRFYVQRGCRLESAAFGAYPAFPEEIRLIFFKAF